MHHGFTLSPSSSGPPCWQAAGLAGVVHAFSTRQGGQSVGPYASLNLGFSSGDQHELVQANRLRLQQALALPEAIATAHQVHGAEVIHVAECGLKADALVSGPGEGAIGVITADCTPILLWDPQSGAVGAVHAGWRGSAAGVVGACVARMEKQFGSKAEALVAAIGPHLRPCCFEVGPEVMVQGTAQAGWLEAFTPGRGDRMWLDQAQANRSQLMAAGLAPGSISMLNECTKCQSERYFSWRRDGGITGRMLSLISPQSLKP